MDMQCGIKCLVLRMDSSSTGALRDTAASNDSIFSSTSKSWLCVNALLAQLALTQKNREGKKDRHHYPYTILLSGFIICSK